MGATAQTEQNNVESLWGTTTKKFYRLQENTTEEVRLLICARLKTTNVL